MENNCKYFLQSKYYILITFFNVKCDGVSGLPKYGQCHFLNTGTASNKICLPVFRKKHIFVFRDIFSNNVILWFLQGRELFAKHLTMIWKYLECDK